MSIIPKLSIDSWHCQLKSMDFVFETAKLILQFIRIYRGPRLTKAHLQKNKEEGLALLDMKMCHIFNVTSTKIGE